MADAKEISLETVAHHEVAASEPERRKLENIRLGDEIEAYESRSVDFRTIVAILALAITYEASLFSFVLPAAILLTIDASIGPSANTVWIATSWSLATAVVQTIAGRCSDIFGRRNFFITGNVLGLVGCAIASRANSINVVIAGTAVMGVAAGLQLLAFAAVSEIVPKKLRGPATASLSVISLPGSTFGSPIAYALVANLSWRWTFYLGIIMNGLGLILICVFYWPPGFIGLHLEGKGRLQQFKELDFVGLILFGAGLTIFLVGVSSGGADHPWTDARVLAPLIIGGLTVVVAFPLWEVYSSDKIAKLCPPHLVENVRGFTLPLCVIFAGGMTLISLQVLWPQEIQLLYTTVPRMVGWYSLAYNAPATAGAVFGGVFFAIIKRTRYQFLAYVSIMVLFTALMATVNQHTAAKAIGFIAVASFATGAAQADGVLFVQLGAKDQDIGVATGLLNSIRSTGGAIGISIYSTALRSKVAANLASTVAAAAVQAGLPTSWVGSFVVAIVSGSEPALAAVDGVSPAIIAAGADAVRSVYSSGFRLVYLISLGSGILAIIGVCFVRSVDDKLTSQIAVKLDKPHLLGHGRGEAKVLSQADDGC